MCFFEIMTDFRSFIFTSFIYNRNGILLPIKLVKFHTLPKRKRVKLVRAKKKTKNLPRIANPSAIYLDRPHPLGGERNRCYRINHPSSR